MKTYTLKTKHLVCFLLILTFSCEEMINITFTESSLEFNKNAIVEVNIPKAEGNPLVSENINHTIENHIANSLVFSEELSDTISLEYALDKFDSEYAAFKSDFEESALVWEGLFDGEVTYQSPMLITIAINSYLNTGGAHGNMNITLFNFDALTGQLLSNEELIADMPSFIEIAEKHFKLNTKTEDPNGFDDYFFGEGFHLPANIGLNDEGILLFYNVYEIASYAVGITEFTIPFDEVEDLLNVF